MIQDQNIQSKPLYEQVQVINSSDQPVCVTGLDNYWRNSNLNPIVIQKVQPYQRQDHIKQLNQKIILITSPRTEKLETSTNRVFHATPQTSYQAYNINCPKTTKRIIHVPFLTRSPLKTTVVKQSSPVKIVSVKTTQQETDTNTISLNGHLAQTPTTANILIDDDFNLCSPYSNHSQEKIQSSPPRTLASMAGIQLTGSVESLPAAMSGAMPTATVEEINVPVFINEYLQSAFLPPISNGNDQSKINKCKTTQGSENNNLYIEKSIDNCIDSDIFENFELDDIGLITADDNTDSESNFNIQTEEQQKEIIMFSNDYFKNNNYNINFDNNNIEDFSTNFQNMICDDIKEVTKTEIKEENDDWNDDCSGNPVFAPLRESDDILFEDDIFNCPISMQYISEDAIDITPLASERDCISLHEIMTCSQNNPMFSATAINNSQTLLNAEPIVPDINANNMYDVKVEEFSFDSEYEHSRSDSSAVKRMNISSDNETDVREKRRKLHLETKLTFQNEKYEDLNTPGVVDLIDQMGSDKPFAGMHYKSTKDIISELQNCSNSSYQSDNADINTPFTVISFDDIDEQPNTPLSCISSTYSTNQTHTITSPNSPALSTISTTTIGNSTAKSRRGRPPKLHSDRPDPSELLNLSESERKRREDRAKNNEASRLSRLKNKQREEEKIREENILKELNNKLLENYNRLCREEQKLKRALERRLRSKN